jgi:alkylglycerol monooxygenase
METYGKILVIASPLFLLFVLAEKLYGWKFKNESFKPMDMLSSLSSGYTNTVKDVLKLGVSIITYDWMLNNWAVYKIDSTVLTYVVAFIALDFTGYWGHRINHQINFFWNQHLIHHSSEEFNLACALRQSISGLINFFTIFLLPAALLGVPSIVIAIVAPIHLFAQFWYHTVHIGRMGFLEHIIVTPSHHRVHHAINPEYMDKNLGQIFIVWDKLFGTFQEELPHVPPVYGITRPVSTWNPIKINFQHLWLIIKDAWRASSWLDKLRIWFMPTGWRPADVAAQFPVHKIENPYDFQKYNPSASARLITWTWIQFLATYSFLNVFFMKIGQMTQPEMLLVGGFIFLSVYAYTELMDRNPSAVYWEIAKNLVGLYILIDNGSWYGLGEEWNWLIGAYLCVSTGVVWYFVSNEITATVKKTVA